MTAPNMADVDSLELFNEKTGERLPVVPDMKEWPDNDREYRLAEATPDEWLWFNAAGRELYNRSNWIIRNKPEASPLPEPVLAYLRERAEAGDEGAVKLLPVDPLLIEAREIAAGALEWSASTKSRFLCGERDNHTYVQLALVGLKRGIELAKAGAA